jgi:hypothetical protein
MIGISEAAIILVVGAIFFFGKNKVLDWAAGLAQVKKRYETELKKTDENETVKT